MCGAPLTVGILTCAAPVLVMRCLVPPPPPRTPLPIVCWPVVPRRLDHRAREARAARLRAPQGRDHERQRLVVRRGECRAAVALLLAVCACPVASSRAAGSPCLRRAFPSCTRSILTEMYLCHACPCQEIEDGNAAAVGVHGSRQQARPLVVDVGSNHGLYALYAALLGADVVAVEPQVRRVCRAGAVLAASPARRCRWC
jgi:hypothetical protein